MLNVNIENISVSIQGSFKELVSDISISLPENSVYTILGKNGSGKSTLVKALTGLLDNRFYKVKGRVEWKGQDLLTIKSNELLKIRKSEIRYVFQDALNSLDTLKKLRYYFDNTNCSKKRFEELLEEFQLPDFKSVSERHSYELSGGMLQRLNFVLALAAEPQLIILDEPTSSVDVVNSLLSLIAVKKFVHHGNNSVLIITQDISFAQKASDKIAFLTDRTLSEFLNVNDFMNSDDDRLTTFIISYKELIK